MPTPDNIFTPVSAGRISSAIVGQIEEAIADGSLKPGDRLPPERELAEIMKVSRITVRDALRTMEALGLVDIRVGASGGAFVQAPPAHVVERTLANMVLLSDLDPDEVAEARLAVELNIVTLACRRSTENDIAELRQVMARARESLEAGTYQTESSREFHVRLAHAAHNLPLEMLVRSFRGPFSMAAIRAREPADIAHRKSVAEHAEIVEHLARSDVPAARQAMARHLVRSTTLATRAADLVEGDYDEAPKPSAPRRRTK